MPRKKLVAAKQLPDGSWERVPDKDLVRLDPGVDPDEEEEVRPEPQRQLEAPKPKPAPVEPTPITVPKLPELKPDEIAAQEMAMTETFGFGDDAEPEFDHDDEKDEIQ